MLSFEKTFDGLLSTAEGIALQVAERAVLYTAEDVRRAAMRSIKSGGKNKRAKNWSVSKPGEPPKSHRGTLKNAIRYEKTGEASYLIGPERVGASKTLRTLEYGGEGEFRETDFTANYVKKAGKKRRRKSFSSASRRCRVHGTVRASRPQATRPYYLYSSELGRGRWVREYRYFYSKEEWEAARNSVSFQSWAERQRRTTRTSVRVDARPFMRPALESQTTPAKSESRLLRAARRQVALEGVPF